MSDSEQRLSRVRSVRTELHEHGPAHLRPAADSGDFARVSVPRSDCDRLRDVLIADGAGVVIEVGLAYGSSALAIGEALLQRETAETSHIIVDSYQTSVYGNVGWEALLTAGLASHSRLFTEPSCLVLARLLSEGFTADAAFVDGRHRFHEVFVDLYYLRKLVRPGGLIILDDTEWPSVATALRYYDRNLGWQEEPLGGRLAARRLPMEFIEPPFGEFAPF